MKLITFTLFSTLCSVAFFSHQHAPDNSRKWALLVAGSRGWGNYRHQACVCHAYHVLHNHGIPDERIVVMMYDDIAYNPKNPTPGIIVNSPGGPDVYHGVPHDYTGQAVSPLNFLHILKGDKVAMGGIGSGKVIDSGPNDHIFVYFIDHGSTGILCFPNSVLSARELNRTITYMYENRRYEEMVFYIEACHSGSMFENVLSKNIKVFATTAARPNESSYACCYDRLRSSWVGSAYSVNWMDDSDKENLLVETLDRQYEIVKEETKTSHVQKYGDMSVGLLHVGDFQGSKPTAPTIDPQISNDLVPNGDADLEVVKRKILSATNEDERDKWEQTLDSMISNRKFLSDTVKAVVDNLAVEDPSISDLWGRHLEIKDFDCYDKVRKYFEEECFELYQNQYALQFMYILVNLCEHGVHPEKQKKAMEKVCIHSPVSGIV